MYVSPVQTLNETMRRSEQIHTNAQYRKFLQTNSSHLRGYNQSTADLQTASKMVPPNTIASEASDLKDFFMQRNF